MAGRITSSLAGRLLGVSQQTIERLANSGVLECELVQMAEDRFMKVFQRDYVEKFKKQREEAKAESKKAA